MRLSTVFRETKSPSGSKAVLSNQMNGAGNGYERKSRWAPSEVRHFFPGYAVCEGNLRAVSEGNCMFRGVARELVLNVGVSMGGCGPSFLWRIPTQDAA